MSDKSFEEKKPSTNPEKERTQGESVLKDTVDPQDLAYTNRSTLDPDEIGTNPALAPETIALNDPAEVREAFKFDRD
jgi:hypothetical protein